MKVKKKCQECIETDKTHQEDKEVDGLKAKES